MGCHCLLQGIFLNQGSNPGLPHCRQMLYCLNHQGSPKVLLLSQFEQGGHETGSLADLPKVTPHRAASRRFCFGICSLNRCVALLFPAGQEITAEHPLDTLCQVLAGYTLSRIPDGWKRMDVWTAGSEGTAEATFSFCLRLSPPTWP